MCKLDYDKMREPEFNGMAQSEINSVKDYYEIIPDLPITTINIWGW